MATANDIAQLAAGLAQLAERLAAQRPDDAQPTPRPLPPRVLLTVEEAGERLGIGRTTAYSLVRSGELQSVRIGRLRRISVSAIDEFAARLVAESSGKAAA
ncbi:helix-turn-helix domain-containing protein [Amycolatopsis sp. NPDC051903]|uniref:helix-turn-helix domain-containing protein n=1 Tax=Amycolatopsis sp. NPDC051903 TaxID=3363936 RepID=UPI0037B5BA12